MNKIFVMIEEITKYVANKVLKKELREENLHTLIQFIQFGVIGLSNTLLSYILYAATLLCLKNLQLLDRIDYLLAQIIAFLLSVLWSFYWNHKYVFANNNQKTHLIKSLCKTYISYSFTGLFLNSVLLFIWIDLLHISEFIAPVINLFISVPVNFLMNKFWAFK